MQPCLKAPQRGLRSAAFLAVGLLATTLAAPAAAHEMSPLPEAQWTRDKAAHLLRRAGFGGTAAEIDATFALGVEKAVSSLVDFESTEYTPAPPAMSPEVAEPIDRREMRSKDEEERQKARMERNKLERQALIEMRLWWLERMVESPRPLEEKMTLFWHGHFTSGAREVQRSWFLWEQNQMFRNKGFGSFRELVLSVSRDRAMLVYLDNVRNHARSPNENYARELLELFTLGTGNYTEADIRAAARAFTGWSFNESGYLFRERDHDPGPKKFLSRSGNFGGEDVIDIILEQPACSEFLARALLEFFLTPDPPKPLVRRFAAEIRKNRFAIKPTLRTLFSSEAFYDPAYRGALIKGPFELIVSTARQLGVRVNDLIGASRLASEMGQELFQPPNVKGWDGGEKWVNTATLFTRYNTVGGLIFGDENRRGRFLQRMLNDEESNEEGAMSMGGVSAKARTRVNPQPTLNVRDWLADPELATAERIVGHFADNLLAVPLPSEKRALLVSYLEGESGRFTPRGKEAEQRLRTMLHLLCSTPEFQLY
ncbi:MAG: DUF1800 domain-containing protein [Phycisphaerae bacterium]|nr:DUF1800 domain-containing protein [Phycisphaerae bacterium]